MSKHKLAGKAIKGDGTQETAERIKKVFEADGWNVSDWTFETTHQYGCPDTGAHEVELDIPRSNTVHPYNIIPLTEAEALVFGKELKAGMMVVFTDEMRKQAETAFDSKIHEIKSVKIDVIHFTDGGYGFVGWLRRATLRDFLSTLPEDIAERALRQVDESNDDYTEFPDCLRLAVSSFNYWCKTEEQDKFWFEVSETNYDRARELLRPATDENRVGKWWKHEDSSIIFGVEYDEEGNLHGYGFDAKEHLNWFHYEGNTHYIPCCNKKQLRTLTPADPKEVERMLNNERVKRGLVEGVEFMTPDRSKYLGHYQGIAKGKVGKYIHYVIHKDINEHVLLSCGVALFSNGQWATIIESEQSPDTEQADPMCDSELSSSDKPNTDKFPRMMWVWDDEVEEAEQMLVEGRFEGAGYAWRANKDTYMCASDTHPVTGQPATEKSVVEQIRDVVENKSLTHAYQINKIKAILDK